MKHHKYKSILLANTFNMQNITSTIEMTLTRDPSLFFQAKLFEILAAKLTHVFTVAIINQY